MPLIDVMTKRGFRLQVSGSGPMTATGPFLRRTLGPQLPKLFASNSAAFGMGDTPESGVQVTFREFSPDDINTPDLWVKVQLSEEPPEAAEQARIRGAIFDALVGLMHGHNLRAPDNFVLDVLWGPTSGCGSVNGVFIEW
ncbi:MAG TPA: hypothetical protein VIQ80_00405 [Candidatus Saccharimonadales bacterium]